MRCVLLEVGSSLMFLVISSVLSDILCNKQDPVFRCICQSTDFAFRGSSRYRECFGWIQEYNLTLISIHLSSSKHSAGFLPNCYKAAKFRQNFWLPAIERKLKLFIIDRYNVFCRAREGICLGARLYLPEEAVVLLRLRCDRISFVILRELLTSTTHPVLDSQTTVNPWEAVQILSFWTDVFKLMFKVDGEVRVEGEPFWELKEEGARGVWTHPHTLTMERILVSIGLAALLCSTLLGYCIGAYIQ